MLLLYGGAHAQSREGISHPSVRIYAMAGGYLAVWALFSVGATALQRLLASWSLLTLMMEPAHATAAAALLLLAGIYQLTPLKQACLVACRSPIALLSTRLARRHRRRLPHGRLARAVLPGLLLGADAAAVRRRRHESCGHPGADRVGGDRKARAVRAAERAGERRPAAWCRRCGCWCAELTAAAAARALFQSNSYRIQLVLSNRQR